MPGQFQQSVDPSMRDFLFSERVDGICIPFIDFAARRVPEVRRWLWRWSETQPRRVLRLASAK